MIPKLDTDIGISLYTTKFAGCGGMIKQDLEDFKVAEVLADNALKDVSQESGYAVYIMKKTGIDTSHALQLVRKNAGLKLKALGLKDAKATTEQYVCATSRSTKLESYDDDRVALEPVGYVQRPLSGKDMIANSFEITVKDHNGTINDFDEWSNILNFYAYQRFGSARAMTHLVGKALVSKDWDAAVDIVLKYGTPYESDSTKELRDSITNAKTFKEMLEIMPHSMDIERDLAIALDRGMNSLDAIATLGVQIRRLYVQAYQSFIFNMALCSAYEAGESLEIKQGDVCYGKDGRLCRYADQKGCMLAMPLVGHSYYTKTRFEKYIRDVMNKEGKTPQDFAISQMQAVSLEGGFRTIAIRAKNTSIDKDTIHVSLGRGSYATAVLREILKPEEPVKSGLAA